MSNKNESENWVQHLNLKKGALTKTAAKHGGIKKGGGIKDTFLEAAASGKYGEKTRKRAVLAKTFKKMHH